jgi:hypothetical protein
MTNYYICYIAKSGRFSIEIVTGYKFPADSYGDAREIAEAVHLGLCEAGGVPLMVAYFDRVQRTIELFQNVGHRNWVVRNYFEGAVALPKDEFADRAFDNALMLNHGSMLFEISSVGILHEDAVAPYVRKPRGMSW